MVGSHPLHVMSSNHAKHWVEAHMSARTRCHGPEAETDVDEKEDGRGRSVLSRLCYGARVASGLCARRADAQLLARNFRREALRYGSVRMTDD